MKLIEVDVVGFGPPENVSGTMNIWSGRIGK